jgi:hypothetical protein
MPRKKSHPDQFEQLTTSAFHVRPDWYEKYWLTPDTASPSTGGRWHRSNPLLSFTLCAAIVSMFVYLAR